MSTSTAQSLYSRDVLRLATSLPHDDQLGEPAGSATQRAPLCGSEMSVDVAAEGGKVSAIAIRAKACALGQASAALLRGQAIGMTKADVRELADQVALALQGGATMPASFEALSYASEYRARHGAILLPFDTLLAALTKVQS